MLEFWGVQSIPSLPLLPGPLSPGVVVTDTVVGQIELFDIYTMHCVQTNDLCQIELLEIELFDHLSVRK